MKKKKGFTLIELLAIIVILAIIAVITVPIILGIIDDSKAKASVASAYGFKDSVEKDYATKLLANNEQKLNGTYTITNGRLGNIDLPISGTKPSNGSLVYQNNKLISGCLTIDGYKVQYQNDEFTATKGDCNAALVCGEGEFSSSVYETNTDIVNACDIVMSSYLDITTEDAHDYCNGETVTMFDGEHSFAEDIQNDFYGEYDLHNLINSGIILNNQNSYTLNNASTGVACEKGIKWYYSPYEMNDDEAHDYCNGQIVTLYDKHNHTNVNVSLEEDREEYVKYLEFIKSNILKETSTKKCMPIHYSYIDPSSHDPVDFSQTLPENVDVYVMSMDKNYLCGIENGQNFCLSNNYGQNANLLNNIYNCGLTEETVQSDFACPSGNLTVEGQDYMLMISGNDEFCVIDTQYLASFYCVYDGK